MKRNFLFYYSCFKKKKILFSTRLARVEGGTVEKKGGWRRERRHGGGVDANLLTDDCFTRLLSSRLLLPPFLFSPSCYISGLLLFHRSDWGGSIPSSDRGEGMSTGMQTMRDLVDEAKKRVVLLLICVFGLSYLMSCKSSHSFLFQGEFSMYCVVPFFILTMIQ